MLCGSLDGKGVWGRMDTWICTAESLRRSLETVPTLFIGCESESRSVVSDSLRPHGLYSPRNSPGQNTGVGSLSLLQGIFPTQGSNPGLLNCGWILYELIHKGSCTKEKVFLNKTQMRQINRKMIGLNLTISISIINVKSLNTPIKG